MGTSSGASPRCTATLADLLHEASRTDEAMPHLKESARLLAAVDVPSRPEPEIWKLTDW